MTSRSASRGTVVKARERAGGRTLRVARLSGDYAVPAVAYDGSASGLSADGRKLVLVSPRRRFPRGSTTFAVLDAGRLRLRRVLRLKGDFSFDALSPDGSLMYLINYLSPRDPTRYRVRVYDLRTSRLLRKPVVDPNEPPDEMSGLPITRATSPEGRWAYTLYDGTEHPSSTRSTPSAGGRSASTFIRSPLIPAGICSASGWTCLATAPVWTLWPATGFSRASTPGHSGWASLVRRPAAPRGARGRTRAARCPGCCWRPGRRLLSSQRGSQVNGGGVGGLSPGRPLGAEIVPAGSGRPTQPPVGGATTFASQ